MSAASLSVVPNLDGWRDPQVKQTGATGRKLSMGAGGGKGERGKGREARDRQMEAQRQ